MPRFAEQQLYIGGRYVAATGGATFETLNPATGEVLAVVQSASRADVDKAVELIRSGRAERGVLVCGSGSRRGGAVSGLGGMA